MSQLLPYETIVKASEGDPEAVAAVLSHYAGYIRSCAKMDGQINMDITTSGNATKSFRTRWGVGLTCSTVVCRPVVPMAPAHPASTIRFRQKP